MSIGKMKINTRTTFSIHDDHTNNNNKNTINNNTKECRAFGYDVFETYRISNERHFRMKQNVVYCPIMRSKSLTISDFGKL